MPASIDATGATDVTDLLNTFLARVPEGTLVTFASDGRYRVDGTVLLKNRRNVTIDGNGATFFAPTDGSTFVPKRGAGKNSWPRLRAHWRIRGGGGITLRDLTIEGPNAKGGATAAAYVAALEGQAGIAIQRTSDVLVDAVTVRNTYGDAVYITGGSANVTVRTSTLERTGRQGVAIVNASNVVVENNEIRDIARSVFDLEPAGRARAAGIHLRENTIGDYVNFLLAAGGGGPGVGDVWLEGNQVHGGRGVSVFAGIEGQRRTGLHILDNSGTGASKPPPGTGAGLIQLLNLAGVEIRGNHQRVDDVPAVSLDRVCDATIVDNEFPGASKDEVVVRPCGAGASVPAPTTPTTSGASTPTATAAPVESRDHDDTSSTLLGLAVGLAVGLGLGVGGFALWRYRSRNRD